MSTYGSTTFHAGNSGLPSDRIAALAADLDGGLWIATPDAGLAHFYQNQWRTYSREDGKLPSSSIGPLLVTSDSALWVGTDSGLVRHHQNEWTRYAMKDGLPSAAIQDLAEDPEGGLWVGTSGGLAHIDGENAIAVIDSSGPAMKLAVTPEGELWASNIFGWLSRYRRGKRDTVDLDSVGLNGRVAALGATSDGALWVGINDIMDIKGLARFKQGKWKTYPVGAGIEALAEAEDGALWVGSVGGLARVSGGEIGEATPQVFNTGNSNLQSNSISDFLPTPDGGLWVGTHGGGLTRFHKQPWIVFNNQNSELATNTVSAITTTSDGSLWVGSASTSLVNAEVGNLARFHDGSWQTRGDSILHGRAVRAFATTPDGALWIGSYGKGLSHFYQGEWKTYTTSNSDLPSNYINALAVNPRDNSIWIGTGSFTDSVDGGLAHYYLEEESWEVYRAEENGLPENTIQSLAITPALHGAMVWVGTGGSFGSGVEMIMGGSGLARLYREKWRVFDREKDGMPSDNIRALAVASDNKLWVGTDAGLAQVIPYGFGRIKVANIEDGGVAGSSITALAALGGALWVGTGTGLSRYVEGHWQHFNTRNSGLPDDRVLALHALSDHVVGVGTVGGGLAIMRRPESVPQIADFVGLPEAPFEIKQSSYTFAVNAFDPTYLTRPEELRYEWTLVRRTRWDRKELEREIMGGQFNEFDFSESGEYAIRVVAIDRNGYRSEPHEESFEVALPEEIPWWEWAWEWIAKLETLLGFVLAVISFKIPQWVRQLRSSDLLAKWSSRKNSGVKKA
ncbi:MAG: two-component regulator propeller domain-containing protein [Rhodothermales bacterium]